MSRPVNVLLPSSEFEAGLDERVREDRNRRLQHFIGGFGKLRRRARVFFHQALDRRTRRP
jgi:hypothetical protein